MTGTDLRRVRKGAGLSQRQLGRLFGLSRQAITRWEGFGDRQLGAARSLTIQMRILLP